MKKLLFIVAIATTLFSCSDNTHTVRLPNGSLVEAVSHARSIEYSRGMKVCITRTGFTRWTICSDGEMLDTTYVRSYEQDGKTKVYAVTHKIGQIVNY